MQELLENPYLWTGFSLLVLIVIALKKARAPVQGWLDGEIEKIRTELEQAQQLRVEAEQLLLSYKQKEQEALRDAAAMVAQAEREAEQLRASATRDLQERLQRAEQQSLERISRAEAEAVADVRRAVIDVAAQASAQLLREQMAGPQAASYLDRVIADLPQQLAKKQVA